MAGENEFNSLKNFLNGHTTEANFETSAAVNITIIVKEMNKNVERFILFNGD